MRTKKTIIFILFLIAGIHLRAQEDSYTTSLPDVVPPAPISQIFQKFLGYPISHATGTVDVTIPIYTIEENGLSIPMEMKYHSSGVKAQDPIGVIGSNWSLFPGFKISRTIYGKADEKFPVTYNYNSLSIEEQIYFSPQSTEECMVNGVIAENSRKDGQYDIFNIHLPGVNASFILKKENGVETVVMIPDKPLKITPIFDPITNYITWRLYGFEVVDERGIKYLFGEAAPIRQTPSFVELNSNYYSSPTGWMLREIVFPNSQKVSFTYQQIMDNARHYEECVVVTDKVEDKRWSTCTRDYYSDIIKGLVSDSGYTIIDSDERSASPTHSLVPTSISTSSETIDFTYSSYMLSSIMVKNKLGTIAKQFTFNYNSTNRLLKSIATLNEGRYSFNYYNEDFISNRHQSFDWWGYFNGAEEYNHLPSFSMHVWICRPNGVGIGENMNIGRGANREVNEMYMKSLSLQEVIYPTGGTFKIDYEAHRFTVIGVNKSGGGLRVKSTESYDPVSDKTIRKTYTYEDASYLAREYPSAASLIRTRWKADTKNEMMARQRVMSVFPVSPEYSAYAAPVWYGKVTETTDVGKTEFRYNHKPDGYNNVVETQDYDYMEYCTSEINRLVYSAPWMTSETHYKKNATSYEKVLSTAYTYHQSTYQIYGTVYTPVLFPTDGNSLGRFLEIHHCHGARRYFPFGSPVSYKDYKIIAGHNNLAFKEQKTYIGQDSIVETTSYTYDDERPYNITRKTSRNSTGDELAEEYYYTNHTIPNLSVLNATQQSNISAMDQANYKTSVIQQILRKNNAFLQSKLTGFTKVREGLFAPQTIFIKQGDGTFESRTEYGYNELGNLTYVAKDATTKVAYLWSYGGKYPVAEFKNATYGEVQTAANNIGLNLSTLLNSQSPNMSSVNQLRGNLGGAFVTTFTYQPLIGVTNITNPDMKVTYYNYDTLNRLKEVYIYEDGAKKILEAYKYNFVNP